MDVRFDNKNVVVTGGSQGIGAGVAKAFAANGANVLIGDVKEEGCKKTVEEIRAAGGKADYMICDITNVGQVDALVNKFDKVDVMVHVAGISVTDTLMHADQAKIERLVQVNVVGTSNVIRASINKMKDFNEGKIVVYASMAARRPTDYTGHYAATKAATASLMMSFSLVAAKYNININGIAPGVVATDMWLKQNAEFNNVEPGSEKAMEITKLAAQHLCPMGRLQTVEDMANATMFLASDFACNITGQLLNVDGGVNLQL